jgi:hypothetical protein
MAPTKAELQTQLRELNRGFPRMPVSKMKVHELEAAIDGMKKAKEHATTSLATKTPALPGPKGPREIQVEEVESGDVAISVPQAPKKKEVASKKKVKIATEDSEDEGPVSPLIPAHRSAAASKAKSEPTHYCNCPACPTKNKK